MPLYRWSSSAVSQMECTSSDKMVQAVLRVQTDADPQVLTQIQASLASKHIPSFVKTEKDGDVLIIPESKGEQPLLDALTSGGWVKGPSQILATAADKKLHPKETSGSFIKKHPLLLTGIFINIGSLAWIISGIMRARHNRDGKFTHNDMSEMMVGVVNAVGGGLLAHYGNDTSKHPLLAFSDGLSEYLKQHGTVVPTHGATPEDIHKSGFFAAAESFIRKNIISITALSKATAAGLVAHSATKQANPNGWKRAGGIIYAAAWLATFALDKPNAPPYEFKSKEPPATQSAAKRLYDWAAENPRKHITAPLAITTQMLKLWGAGEEGVRAHKAVKAAVGTPDYDYHKNRQYDFVWNVIAYSAFEISNVMFGISGDKEPSQQKIDPEGFQKDMLMVSANILNNVPPKARTFAIETAADYVTSIKGVTQSRAEVEKAISDQVDHLQYAASRTIGQMYSGI